MFKQGRLCFDWEQQNNHPDAARLTSIWTNNQAVQCVTRIRGFEFPAGLSATAVRIPEATAAGTGEQEVVEPAYSWQLSDSLLRPPDWLLTLAFVLALLAVLVNPQ